MRKDFWGNFRRRKIIINYGIKNILCYFKNTNIRKKPLFIVAGKNNVPNTNGNNIHMDIKLQEVIC